MGNTFSINNKEMELFKKFTFKNFTLTRISDLEEPYQIESKLFPKATPEILKELQLGDKIDSTISTFLLEKDGKKAMFDLGYGDSSHKVGHTLERLNDLKISPDDIDYIFITHLHGDHYTGYLKNNEPAFKKAKVYISRQEYEGWKNMETSEKQKKVLNFLEKAKENIVLFNFGEKLPLDIVGINTSGHTPGHTVYQLENILIIGDLIHAMALQLVHPEICAIYDKDEEKSIESRKKIIQMAKENKLIIAGMHFPGNAMYFKYNES